MIPFKAIKYSAVLIILICIQKSLQKEAEIGRRRFDFRDSVRTSLYSNARVSPSKYIQDVRADSRRARIDSRDIRTDFREIMDVSSTSNRYMDSQRESRFDGNRRYREFARNRNVARMNVVELRNQLRGFTTRDSRISPAREDVSGIRRVSERSFVAADGRDTREVRSSRDTSAFRSDNLVRRESREFNSKESLLSTKRDLRSVRRSLFSVRNRDFSDNQLRTRREESRLAKMEATRKERKEVIANVELNNVRLPIRKTKRDLTSTRDGSSGLSRKEIGRSLSSERRNFATRREERHSASTPASRVVRAVDSIRDSRFYTRKNERDMKSARLSGSARSKEIRFTRAAVTRRNMRRDTNASNARMSVTRTERDLSSTRDESRSFIITSERREFYDVVARRDESRFARSSVRRDINAREARLFNVRSEERDLVPTSITEDRRISSPERIRDSSKIYSKDARRIEKFRALSRDANNGDINNDFNRAQIMDEGLYIDALVSSRDTERSNIVRNAIEAVAIIWLVGLINRQNSKGGLGMFRSWLQPCKIN
ncbi:zinc finger CCCH domain-containing protein 13-like [Euwallacea fornicatus]|uniref:zinc finger CCCH domain-containing protein 13-like n=1 Tax=Euwallacea fornicatus TaxID=995702 RepID=UPI0033907792